MSYGTSDIGSLRFLAANVIYQVTGKLLQGDDASDRGALDDAALLMDVISSYHTETDDKFAAEWGRIQEDRRAALAAVPRGMELAPEEAEKFRWRELRAQFRSLCRKGTFVRQEAPTAEWVPGVKGAS